MTARHDGRKLVIDGATAEARRIGLHPGLPVGEAQARVPGLVVRPADPDGDDAALRRLARLCLRFAPLTAPDPPDGVLVDATGCAHLFGGERRMLRAMRETGASLGFETRAAIAGTPGAAHAVARYARAEDVARHARAEKVSGEASGACFVVVPGGEADALAALPPEALRLPPDLCAQLRRLGLATVADLRRLPRGPLARRAGAAVLRRLDQATGAIDEPIGPEAPPRPIAARLGFVEPLLTAEGFAAAIARLVDDVCGRLDTAGLGARRLELRFERVDGTEATIRVATSRPVRGARHLVRLLSDRLETIDPGLGVEAMRLAVRRAETLEPEQAAVTFGAAGVGGTDLAPLVDTLINRLGVRQVWRPTPVESDVPERTVRPVPFFSQASGPESWPDALARPVRLFDPPMPVTVMALVPDHPPASFIWRNVRHVVRHADGPERIAGEWWRHGGEVRALRDYFRVEDEEGRRFWLFRRGDGRDLETGDMRWFVHGVF